MTTTTTLEVTQQEWQEKYTLELIKTEFDNGLTPLYEVIINDNDHGADTIFLLHTESLKEANEFYQKEQVKFLAEKEGE